MPARDPAPAPPPPPSAMGGAQAPVATMTDERAKSLREPFPASQIGKLPKGGVMLDYVGHAAVTSRLLEVDPTWTWEPLAFTVEGLPALDRAGNLWIRMTLCGVTRIGVGDGKNAKECISDAIRNAAMRFGVALDLWAKEDLRAEDTDVSSQEQPPAKQAAAPVITNPQRKRLWAVAKENTVPEERLRQIVFDVAGVDSTLDIPRDRYDLIIEAVQAQAVPF